MLKYKSVMLNKKISIRSENMIIVSGFEPYGREKINPSMIIAESFDGEKIENEPIKGIVFPVSHKKVKPIVENIIGEKPSIFLALGLSPKTTCIRLEVVALNVAHSARADNDGYKPFDEKIYEDGELAYRGTLPFKKILQKLKRKKIPAVLSYHAGTFLCNYIYYTALHNARKHRTKVGFVHIPHITELIVENPEYPSLPKKTLLEGVKIILKETIKK
ncbi:MAG: pyroglutamyl-peptidase I [Thermoprotei archaeon]|nr:MAG: pyroglutamyl-peptidase I [Thermoprotei archaeon]